MYQLIEDGVFGTPPLVVDAPSILRALIPAFAGRQVSILRAPSRAGFALGQLRWRSGTRPWPWLSRGRGLNRLIHRP
ncbi:MAG: hypothetical protein ACREXM_12530 [Gammaproteobacteria bacterium]